VIVVIVICGAAAVGFGATMVLAVSRAAARADEELDELLARRLGLVRASRGEGYAGFERAQATISLEPSITEPSSSTSAGTQRLPVSS